MRTQPSVGVDVGGTFTDVIYFDADGFRVRKVPTTSNPTSAVSDALEGLGDSALRASLITHATTLATNALLTMKGLARTALVTNEGFRDILEIGRQRRPEVYDLKTRRPPPLVSRRDRLTLRCRIDSAGRELEAPKMDELGRLARSIVSGGYESVAVSFLNSYLNGAHEKRVLRALRTAGFKGPISLSTEVDREYREYERTSTTVVNAALSPLISGYLGSLRSSLNASGIKAPVYVMNSDGSSSTMAFASKRPASIVESGPAAGVVACTVLSRALSLDKVITFDMGGTTAKAGAVLEGKPDIIGEFEAAGRSHSGRSIKGSGYPIRGEFIDLAEVSAGGGTIARLDDAGDLIVGPASAGSDPGPACYARGGESPTVTDANLVLGRIGEELLGGEMKLSRRLATRALARIAGGTAEETAKGILRLVNSAMATAISMVSVERGRDPRDYTLIAFGGAGPGHACDLAEELGVTEVIIPHHAGLFSAYGLLAGELSRSFTAPVMGLAAGLEKRFEALRSQAGASMLAEGFKRFTFEESAEVRYAGQSHELLIGYEGSRSLRRSFNARHKELYGYSSTDPIEIVNIKVKATVPRSAIPQIKQGDRMSPVGASMRRAWVGGDYVELETRQRNSIAVGESGKGPCVLEDYDSTLVVNPAWSWTAEDYGTRLVLR